MTRYPLPGDANLEAFKAAFSDAGLLDALTTAADDAPLAVTPARLYAYVRGEQTHALAIKSAMLANPALRRLHRRMVEGLARFVIPEAIAASSEAFPERSAAGCRVRVVPSRAGPEEFYLIVEIGPEAGAGADVEAAAPPTTLIICDRDDNCEQLDLPAASGGIIQVLIDEASGVPTMLRDPKSAIFLR
jgi:hypothetical protein